MSGGYGGAEKPKTGPVEADVIGWHNMYWEKGQFKVCFRPGGNFYCDKAEHRTAATWKIFDGEVLVDWGKCGRYALTVDEGKHLKGHALPKNEEETNWRKTIYHSSLTPVEKLLFGDGEGTEWECNGPEGSPMGSGSIEFRPDGENMLVCSTREGDAHWSMHKNGKTVIINGGKDFKFELDIDLKSKTMDGYQIIEGVEDNEDVDWRKATFVKNLKDAPKVECSGHGDDEGHGHSHGHSHGEGGGHGHDDGHGSHEFGGGIVGLGNLTIVSEKFMVDREGQVEKGFETEFGFERVGAGKADMKAFKAYLQNGAGQPLCDPVDGDAHDNHVHFHVTPNASGAEALAISCGDQVSTISVHPGASPANDGIMSVLEDSDGKHVGYIELKLHDDAGDLELWLCKDGAMEEPLDFPADMTVTATFATKDDKSVTLAVRDNENNEDEDGKANMRDGKTNYFIFPGESEQDPEFLIGEDFRSTTTLTFTSGGKSYTAPPFILVPHQH